MFEIPNIRCFETWYFYNFVQFRYTESPCAFSTMIYTIEKLVERFSRVISFWCKYNASSNDIVLNHVHWFRRENLTVESIVSSDNPSAAVWSISEITLHSTFVQIVDIFSFNYLQVFKSRCIVCTISIETNNQKQSITQFCYDLLKTFELRCCHCTLEQRILEWFGNWIVSTALIDFVWWVLYYLIVV
jgi:hypothetical protein